MWSGKCNVCESWNSLIKRDENTKTNKSFRKQDSKVNAIALKDVSLKEARKVVTGFTEFDRVVGGGVVPGGLYLVGGDPGVGKSTIITIILSNLSKNSAKALYISGEESASQVALRAKRLKIKSDSFFVLNETSLQSILYQISQIKPSYVVLDSIQTTVSDEISSSPGSMSQIREVTHELMKHIKNKNITCFVIGHITKEGSIAGPKVLEHMVDTVLYFEGDQNNNLRVMRAVKNRFGSTSEIGIFEMIENGLKQITNPSSIFIDRENKNTFGNAITCAIEGKRPILIEIQSLIVDNKYGNGKRLAQGIDNNRFLMIVAIIQKYMEINLSLTDIYLNVVGGIRVMERDSDLSILVSILSSFISAPILSGYVFLGEIGLTGELRGVTSLETRLRELSHLGFKKIVLSKKSEKEIEKLNLDLELITITNVKDLTSYYR